MACSSDPDYARLRNIAYVEQPIVKQREVEHLSQRICLRSEVSVAGRPGFTYSRDDHYRARQDRAGKSEGHWLAPFKLDTSMLSISVRCCALIRGYSALRHRYGGLVIGVMKRRCRLDEE